MKASELMVGDWVRLENHYQGKPVKIISIEGEMVKVEYERYWSSALLPVPLTAEILKKNGFKVDEKDENMLKWNWSVIDDCISYDKSTGKVRIFYPSGLVFVKILRFVHELQHALRLCEIEKEIKL